MAALLTACAASDFSKPISDFSKAAGQTSTNFNGYVDSLQKLKQQQNLSDVAKDPGLLHVDGCKRRSTKCELLVRGKRGYEQLKPQFLPHMQKVMAAIVTYSKNLEAIASTDDVGKLKTATDAIPAEVNGLAKAVDALNAQQKRPTNLTAQTTALSAPVGEIVTIVLTKYAEFEKLRALRGATERMELIFPDAMAALSQVATANQTLIQTAVFRKYQAARHAYSVAVGAVKKKLKEKPPPKDLKTQLAGLRQAVVEALDSYNTAADAYNAALTAKPQATFSKLADAHASLVKALEMPNPDFTTVFQKLTEFGQIASTLATDAQKIDKALHPKATT